MRKSWRVQARDAHTFKVIFTHDYKVLRDAITDYEGIIRSAAITLYSSAIVPHHNPLFRSLAMRTTNSRCETISEWNSLMNKRKPYKKGIKNGK